MLWQNREAFLAIYPSMFFFYETGIFLTTVSITEIVKKICLPVIRATLSVKQEKSVILLLLILTAPR